MNIPHSSNIASEMFNYNKQCHIGKTSSVAKTINKKVRFMLE